MNDLLGGEIIGVANSYHGPEGGVLVGDHLLAVNGRQVRDVLDCQFYGAEGVSALELRRGDKTIAAPFPNVPWHDFQFVFCQPMFDGLRTCRNRCFFCFVDGMPEGLRDGLYVKDDDYRHSFLFGNFVTLTNLNEEDWKRIAEQRLGPLYVSVHTSDPDLRCEILGNKKAPDIMEQLRRLAELRIQVHAQIVLFPGVNDADQLKQTLADLTFLYPSIQSIAVVPVGVTRYNASGQRLDSESGGRTSGGSCSRLADGMRRFTFDEARDVLAIVRDVQKRNQKTLGGRLVYAADEFYLLTGASLPGGTAYEDYPQYANGVGMTRSFVDDWRATARRWRKRDLKERRQPRRIGLVTGRLFAPVLDGLCEEFNADSRFGTLAQLHIEVIDNALFGPSVTVAGLLGGEDVLIGLGKAKHDMLVLPRTMLDAVGERTLDDLTQEQIRDRTQTRVEFVIDPKGLFKTILLSE